LAVVRYLGNYTHRIAISNNRIISIDEDTVTFAVRDKKNANAKKTVTMKGVEFVRRFLMHSLPKGFVKIRHYGLLANRNKKTKLELSKKLTRTPEYQSKFEGLKAVDILSIIIGKDVSKCPACDKGKLTPVRTFYKGSPP